MRRLTAALAAALPCLAAAQDLPVVRVPAARLPSAHGVLAPVQDRLDQAPLTVRVLEPGAPGVPITELLLRDAALTETYAVTGYYPNFSLRGFLLDHASSWRVNGFVVPGELDPATDHREAVEVLHGIGNLSGGTVGAGGSLNFVSRRPSDARTAWLGLAPRGGRLLGLDLGRAAGEAAGWRLHVVQEDLRPAERRAQGWRQLVAFAGDAAAGGWRLALDAELAHRRQPAVPGFQLLGGSVLPAGMDPRTNINQQAWSRPVDHQARLLQLRARRELATDLRLDLGASDAEVRIDDSLAFPFGCNEPPLQYFCAEGRYVLYDYRAQERRRSSHLQASVSGAARAGAWRHEFHLGAEAIQRRVVQQGLYSSTVYDDQGRAMTGDLAAVERPLPAPPTAGSDLPDRRTTQQALFAADRLQAGDWQLHLGWRLAHVDQQPAGSARTVSLPQAGLSWSPAPGRRAYLLGARGLSTGSEAPLVAANAGQLLPSRLLTQWELGWREDTADFAWQAALLRMRRPFEFTQPEGPSWAGLGAFVQQGRQVHAGLVLAGRGRLAPAWSVGGQVVLLRAQARGTGVPAYDGTQLQNVPRVRSHAWLRHAPRAWPGVAWELAWLHVGERNALRDGRVQVPGYDRLDLALEVAARDARWRWRLEVQNLLDRRYWRDAGEAYSADLLFPGRPRSGRVVMSVDL